MNQPLQRLTLEQLLQQFAQLQREWHLCHNTIASQKSGLNLIGSFVSRGVRQNGLRICTNQRQRIGQIELRLYEVQQELNRREHLIRQDLFLDCLEEELAQVPFQNLLSSEFVLPSQAALLKDSEEETAGREQLKREACFLEALEEELAHIPFEDLFANRCTPSPV